MRSKSIIVAFLLLLPLMTLPWACAKKATPPVDEPQGNIVIGILNDFSGVTAGFTTAHVEGEKDAIRYINEEMGGINGHPLEYIIIDHKLDATLMLSGWDRLKNEGVPLILSYAGTLPILETVCQEDRIAMLGTFSSIDQGYPKEPSYFFCQSPHLPGTVASALSLMEQDWAKKGKTGTPKIAFDVVTLGTSGIILGKTAKMEMQKRGWDYTITRTSTGPADVTTQVLQVKNFGADYLYMLTSEAAVSCGSRSWKDRISDRRYTEPPIVDRQQ